MSNLAIKTEKASIRVGFLAGLKKAEALPQLKKIMAKKRLKAEDYELIVAERNDRFVDFGYVTSDMPKDAECKIKSIPVIMIEAYLEEAGLETEDMSFDHEYGNYLPTLRAIPASEYLEENFSEACESYFKEVVIPMLQRGGGDD